jgi:hypothetical protein
MCALLASCSWTQMDVLPGRPVVGASYACDATRGAPTVDTVVAGLFAVAVVGTIIGVGQCLNDPETTRGCSTAGIGWYYLALSVAYGSSAHYGFEQASRCRAYLAGQLAIVPAPAGPTRP